MELSRRTTLRVSFSITTNREAVRKLYEPHCATIDCRLKAIRELRAGRHHDVRDARAACCPAIPKSWPRMALEATDQDIIGDALHIRAVKPRGATTREAAFAISERHGFSAWLDAGVSSATWWSALRRVVHRAGRRFATGTEGFGWLAQ